MTEEHAVLWSENIVRGMRHLALEAYEKQTVPAYGLDGPDIEWAILTLDNIVNRCQDGYFRDPLSDDALNRLDGLRRAALNSGYNLTGRAPFTD